jgi:hypothetical protein
MAFSEFFGNKVYAHKANSQKNTAILFNIVAQVPWVNQHTQQCDGKNHKIHLNYF